MIDKQDTVEVVYLVLQSLGQESFPFDSHLFPLAIQGLGLDRQAPSYGGHIAWKTETPFFYLSLPSDLDDLRIDQDDEILLGRLNDRNSQRHSNLRSGKTDTRCRSHGINHIIDKLLNGPVDGLNLLRFLPKKRIIGWQYVQHRHLLTIRL